MIYGARPSLSYNAIFRSLTSEFIEVCRSLSLVVHFFCVLCKIVSDGMACCVLVVKFG